MGTVNNQALPRLQQEIAQGMYDAILHVGDMAYNMHENNGSVGDTFMGQIESVAAYVPYMTVPGNHESAYNFSNYRARFSMPGNTESLYYSFDMGPAHFIGFSTEVYYYTRPLIRQQYEWLEADLKKATANRKERPWIITYGHRPMYCTDADDDDCTRIGSKVRVGLPPLFECGVEDLFYQYGVDVEIWAHEHSYERLWPLYNYAVYNGSEAMPYTNPGAPVQIVTGSAGSREETDTFVKPSPPWTAFRSSDYGTTRMTIHNATHLYFEQVSDSQNGEVIDRVWVIRDKHGPYPKH